MSVERINPSSVYVQNELVRIQDNLIRGLDNSASPATQLVDAGYYWSTNYPGGIVTSMRTIYNASNNTATITQWFQFPVTTTILGISVLNNNAVSSRTDAYIYSGGQQVHTSQGIVAPLQLYGSDNVSVKIPANTQFHVAYGYPVSGLNIATYSYLLLQVGS